MGITNDCARFLIYAKKQEVSFDKTMMLGRQQLYVSRDYLAGLSKKFFPLDLKKILDEKYAEKLFSELGAHSIDSMDISEFEGATIKHDLNLEIPDYLKNHYDFVFDGGTLEHIFNLPVALINCMKMLKVGGHFVSITPANNQCGHGFYQFSPELFYSIFSEQYGFKVISIVIAIEYGAMQRDWYSVVDPRSVKSRVTLRNHYPSYLLVLAKKESDFDKKDIQLFQSDYLDAWTSLPLEYPDTSYNPMKSLYRQFVPKVLRDRIYTFRKQTNKYRNLGRLGFVRPDFYKKLDF